MPSFNQCVQLGNLVADPVLKYTTAQTAVCEFGLAINHKWTDAAGKQRDEVCFIDVCCFGRLAENVNKYMSKGSLVLVAGRLTQDRWTGKDGTSHSKHRIVADTVQFMPVGGKVI